MTAERQIRSSGRRFLNAAAIAGFLLGPLGPGSYAPALAQGESSLPPSVFAVIDGESIGQTEFDSYLVRYLRSKLYHGGSKERLAQLRGEAIDGFIDERLVIREAERRAIVGDAEAVAREVEELERRYEGTEAWNDIEDRLPALRALLLDLTRKEALEASVREVADPGEAELARYHEENLDLFTLPQRNRLSVILLGVDPGAPSSEWRAARIRANEVSARLTGFLAAHGAVFAELAKTYSTHHSAADGGDMGVVHEGELSKAAQDAVNRLEVGEVTQPIYVLEGYVIFKLEERMPAETRSLEAVRDRVLALYRRDTSQQQWDRFLSDLRGKAEITVKEAEDVAQMAGDRYPE